MSRLKKAFALFRANQLIGYLQGVFQKFCIAQPFSVCGNTLGCRNCVHMLLKAFRAHTQNFTTVGSKLSKLFGDEKITIQICRLENIEHKSMKQVS